MADGPRDLRYSDCGTPTVLHDPPKAGHGEALMAEHGMHVIETPLTMAQERLRARREADFDQKQAMLRLAAKAARLSAALRRSSDPDLAGMNKYLFGAVSPFSAPEDSTAESAQA